MTPEEELAQEREHTRAVTEEMHHFVYAVSHDLRQPLRNVLTSAQLLARGNELAGTDAELVQSIVAGALEMNSLVDRLLTYSRAGSNLRRLRVNLSVIVDWTAMSLAKLIKERGATVTHGQLPEVEVDDSALSAVFEQLITNSILYRGKDSPSVQIEAKENEEGHIISVFDNGCGIPTEFQEKVFVPLQRLHGREIPGFGLGLPICRKILRAHGGKIWIESNGVSGTAVHFNIPN